MLKNVSIRYLLTATSLALTAPSPVVGDGGVEASIVDSKTTVTAVFIGHKKNPLANPVAGLEREIAVFEADGLRQYALLLKPRRAPPEAGWPMVIFNHGFHPTPHNNGRRSEDGISDRPGDYYRLIPAAIARAGFLVVSPDYRGHHDSEGPNFTLRRDSPNWYARDVQAVVTIAGNFKSADLKNIFMLGHSMGAAVTLRAASVLGERIRAVSLWSAAMMVPENSALNAYGDADRLSSNHPQQSSDSPSVDLSALQCELNIHHSNGDSVADIATSYSLAQRLQRSHKTVTLYTYKSQSHLFTGANLSRALERDIRLFRRHTSADGLRLRDAIAPLAL